MNEMLKTYVDETIKRMGFEAKETIEIARLAEECEQGIIPFEFVQKWFQAFIA